MTREWVGRCRVAVVDDGGGVDRAAAVARFVGCPVVGRGQSGVDASLLVRLDRLELQLAGDARSRGVFVDFIAGRGRHRRPSARQPLARAVGVAAGRTVVDATAGFGADAFTLASLGCRVTAVERSPIVFALLRDGLDRAATVPALESIIRERLKTVVADGRAWLYGIAAEDRPDVVYLDPMYVPEPGATALVRKEMRWLRTLVGDDGDAVELFEVARRVARERVVVKRMGHAPPLGGEPTVRYQGTVVRYDAYFGA